MFQLAPMCRKCPAPLCRKMTAQNERWIALCDFRCAAGDLASERRPARQRVLARLRQRGLHRYRALRGMQQPLS